MGKGMEIFNVQVKLKKRFMELVRRNRYRPTRATRHRWYAM